MGKVYLENIPRQEARDRFLSEVEIPTQTEQVQVAEALGRVNVFPVFANLSMPAYHAAAMDGIAVKAESTFGASDQTPLTLHEDESFKYVDTGKPLPDGFDAVIKIEDIHQPAEGQVEILNPATPWQHVRAVGEDVVAGELLLPARRRLRPPDIGALLAGGITEIEVLKKPRIAIIPTGSEVIPPHAPREKGKVPDFNSSVTAAYLYEWGAVPEIYPIVPDEPEQMKESIRKAAKDADAVIVIAGSSAGSKDYTYSCIAAQEKGEVFVHGIATRPGKPTILGKIGDKPAVGLPGYPVSAYLSLEWFVRPLVYHYYRESEPDRERISATLGRRVLSEVGTEEHVRMAVGHIKEGFTATPLTRGAGVTMSLVKADGLMIIPAEAMGCEQGDTVEIELYRPQKTLYNNLLAGGSHDPVIDLLATTLKERYPSYTLSSTHLGSMGGIAAIEKEQAHLAGVHLFDPETDTYNTTYVKRFLEGKDILLVTLAHRMQGWIVPPGNPDGIEDIHDLARKKPAFVNRQRGAGTRLLFDHLLLEAGLSAADIYGYEREEHTHLNVAAAVASGTARIGLGILAAAKPFGLDFLPVREERYDLLMSTDFYNSEAGQALVNIISHPDFQKEVESLGGYSMREAGTLISF